MGSSAATRKSMQDSRDTKPEMAVRSSVVPTSVGDHCLARYRTYSRAMTRSAQKPRVREDENGSACSPSCVVWNSLPFLVIPSMYCCFV